MPELVTKSKVAPVASCSKIVRLTPLRSTKERLPFNSGALLSAFVLEAGRATAKLANAMVKKVLKWKCMAI
jgi:hypothetical protein